MEIAEIKSRLPLVSVLARYGLRPDASGRMRCPFHEDRTASFQLYAATESFYCFAEGCRVRSGDVLDLIELKEGCTKAEAIQRAKRMIGEAGDGAATPPPAIDASAVDPAVRRAVLGALFERFRRSAAQSKTAGAYLASRGLDGVRIGAGYNSGRWPETETGPVMEHAEALGLIKDGRAFARGCVVLPLVDAAGAVVSLYGRSVRPNARAKHFYLRGRSGLYPAYPAPETVQLVLAEAPLDAASLLMAELPAGVAVLALYGTRGLTAEHRAAIRALPQLAEIVLVLDGDQAGRAAAAELGAALHELRPDVAVRVARVPEGEDANSVLVTEGPATLWRLVEAAPVIETPAGIQQLRRGDTAPGEEPAPAEAPAPPEATGHLDAGNAERLRFHVAAPPLVMTVLGGVKLAGLDRLRVALRIERTAGPHALALHYKADLYHVRDVDGLVERAADQFELERYALRRVVAALTEALERYRMGQIDAARGAQDEAYQMSAEEEAEARAYLEAPDLLARTGADIGRTGVVGEEANRLLMYLAFTSRLRQQPLHVVALAASGTGKTYLQDAVGRLVPDEQRMEVTSFSEHAPYYLGRTELRHKLLLIEDLDGAAGAEYAIRELQSKGRLTRTVAVKDPSGKIRAETSVVEGPVCVAGCTTRERLYEDNAGRVLLVHLDASAEQEAAVLTYQRRRSAGAVDVAGQERVRRLIQNAQRLLAPVGVRNPYAERLALPPGLRQSRRANGLYLGLIEVVAFYHQRQRELRTDEATGEQYVRATLADVAAANGLIAGALTAKADELSAACRRFLDELQAWLSERGRGSFHTGEVRQALSLSPSAAKRYLYQLRDYGYAEVTGGSRYRKGYEYRLTGLGRAEGHRRAVEAFLAERLEQIKREEAAE